MELEVPRALARFVAYPYLGESQEAGLGESLGARTVIAHVATARILRCDTRRPPQEGERMRDRTGQSHLSRGTSLGLICSSRCCGALLSPEIFTPRMDME